jgi:hypothetical protein
MDPKVKGKLSGKLSQEVLQASMKMKKVDRSIAAIKFLC